MKNSLILFALIFLGNRCSSQTPFAVKEVPASIATLYTKKYTLPKNLAAGAIDLSKYTNADKSADYTEIVQKILQNYKVVIFPNYPIKINKKGLTVPSDRVLFFQPKSKIIFSGPADSRDSDILKIIKVKNVTIYNPTIEGSKFSTEKQWGEWSAGIAILGSENISVYNFNISKTYGDGIIIGNQSKNIIVQDGRIEQARRDGVSLTSGTNVAIKNLVISNTTGTLPMCGIQIEPDFITDNLKNISIQNIVGYNNANATLNMNFGAYNRKEKPAQNADITISVDHVVDYYSSFAIGFVVNADNSPFTPTGIISVKNVKSNSSKSFMWKDGGRSTLKIVTKDLVDTNGKNIMVE